MKPRDLWAVITTWNWCHRRDLKNYLNQNQLIIALCMLAQLMIFVHSQHNSTMEIKLFLVPFILLSLIWLNTYFKTKILHLPAFFRSSKSSWSLLVHLSPRCDAINGHVKQLARAHYTHQSVDVLKDEHHHFILILRGRSVEINYWWWNTITWVSTLIH